jgi:hypothetical protein
MRFERKEYTSKFIFIFKGVLFSATKNSLLIFYLPFKNNMFVDTVYTNKKGTIGIFEGGKGNILAWHLIELST